MRECTRIFYDGTVSTAADTQIGRGLKEQKMDLMMYHGKRIAVVIKRGGGHQVFRCTAVSQHDEDLGPILRIPLEYEEKALPGNPVFILKGIESSECLVEDDRYGCDFRIDVAIANNSDHAIQNAN
ncbi:MAG: hypothetical protein EA424_24460 [Planctomycetaceae bacterium]|nr:MAG: hypothetical protein EA424_24460 [Planctomycetaceae bacterium]